MQTAPSRAAAFGRVCLCVFRELFLRRVGGGKEQQSSNRATESLFLVPFAMGSVRNALSPSPGIKSGGGGRQTESREQPQRMTKTDATMMIIRFTIVTSFRKKQNMMAKSHQVEE